MQTTVSTCLGSRTQVLVRTWLRAQPRGRAARLLDCCLPSHSSVCLVSWGGAEILAGANGTSSSQSISQGKAQPLLLPLSSHALQGPATSRCSGDKSAFVVPFPQAARAGAACLHPQRWLSRLGDALRGLMGSRVAHEVWLGHQGPSPHG